MLRLHRHQREAVEIARDGHSYVLTTGTGSGKSLTYIIPIVDRVLRAKADGSWRPGIKAIVVYPMNALANSQLRRAGEVPGDRLSRRAAGDLRPVHRAGKRGSPARVIAEPPDILLTNYVMLELVLTCPRERRLIEAAHGLWPGGGIVRSEHRAVAIRSYPLPCTKAAMTCSNTTRSPMRRRWQPSGCAGSAPGQRQISRSL